MAQRLSSFGQQRVIYFILLFCMTAYAIGAALVLQWHDGQGLAGDQSPTIETGAILFSAGLGAMAILVRILFNRRAETLDGAARTGARFRSVLIPLLMLDTGCIFATTVWMLYGNAVPSLAAALVLLAVAIAIVPFADPDAQAP